MGKQKTEQPKEKKLLPRFATENKLQERLRYVSHS